jgi:ribonuclease HIII
MDYPYQRQRHDSGELVVAVREDSQKLTDDQIRRIEEELKQLVAS